MTFYKIHNKSNGKDLIYPSVGLWTSPDINEAVEQRDNLRGYLNATGFDFLASDVVIINIDTGEEISEKSIAT